MGDGPHGASPDAPRVLFVTRSFPPGIGGMQKLAFEWYENIRRLMPVDVLAHRGGRKDLPAYFLRTAVQLAAHARRYDIIHFSDASLSPFIGLTRFVSGARTTVTTNGLDVVFNHWGYQRTVIPWLRMADMVFPISDATGRECEVRGVRRERIKVIHPGIDVAPLSPFTNSQKRDLATRLQLPLDGRQILLTVGRLIKRKGHAWFISHVLGQLPDRYVYVIAGSGPEEPALRVTVGESGLGARVRLLGEVSEADKDCLYEMADVFIMPNIVIPNDREGFGIVLTEAGTHGLPVVASDMEGIRDAVVEGKTGRLVTPGNARGFAQAITDPGIERSTIRDTVIARYGWPRIARLFEAEFLQLAAKRHRTSAAAARE